MTKEEKAEYMKIFDALISQPGMSDGAIRNYCRRQKLLKAIHPDGVKGTQTEEFNRE